MTDRRASTPTCFISCSACRGEDGRPSDELFKTHLSSYPHSFYSVLSFISLILCLSTSFNSFHFCLWLFLILWISAIVWLIRWPFQCHRETKPTAFNFSVAVGVKPQSALVIHVIVVNWQWAGLIAQIDLSPSQPRPISTGVTRPSTPSSPSSPFSPPFLSFPLSLFPDENAIWREHLRGWNLKSWSRYSFSGGGKESKGSNKELMSWGSAWSRK